MILNRQRRVRVAVPPLERFLQRAKTEAGAAGSDVTVCFVTDSEMARMNKAFRSKSGSTDVLSFPSEGLPKKGKRPAPRIGVKLTRNASVRKDDAEAGRFLGDIAIAPETARRYAQKNGRTVRNELRVLILHGVLHLMGYDHETDNGEMERVEERLRARLGLV